MPEDTMPVGVADNSLHEQRFFNKEISLLAFNRRVLDESANPRHPLLERLRFLSICGSNLDEFYMTRMAGLRRQAIFQPGVLSIDGLDSVQQLKLVQEHVTSLLYAQQAHFRTLRTELADQGIIIENTSLLADDDLNWLETKFLNDIFPVLTPIAVDPVHPFPFIPNKGFCLVLRLIRTGHEGALYALVPLSPRLERFIRLPTKNDGQVRFVLLERLVLQFMHHLFPTPFALDGFGFFRVLRDSDVEIAEDAEDLVGTFEKALQKRRLGSVIRLTMSHQMTPDLQNFLQTGMQVDASDCFLFDGLLGLADVREMIVDERPDLLFRPLTPRFPERFRDFGGDYFAAIRHKDILVHHPYETFDVVVQFLRQAARDPDVVAIKQTLYRTSKDSPIVKALVEAAESGKSVTAMVEIRARFDEEANLRWARNLERAGAQVVYGLTTLKTHAKISMVVRREADGLRNYIHFATGNYHPVTAMTYTDLSLLSCDPVLGRDAAQLFNYMTSYAPPDKLEKLVIAPTRLRGHLTDLIEQEITHAKAGRSGAIWAKMNALVDPEMIDLLYRAGQAGVQIRLVVRGMCALRPGVPGLSENIRVKSVIGRFLEHSRIYCFGHGHGLPSAQAQVMIASADLMQRNLDLRIETLVPIENPTIHQQIMFQIMLALQKDNTQSWDLQPDGSWHRRTPGHEGAFCAHQYFMDTPSLSGRGTMIQHMPPPPTLSLYEGRADV